MVDIRPASGLAGNPERWPELERQALQLAAVLGAAPGVQAVALLGSVARGEEASALVAGRRELFSDIELLAVTEGRLPAARRTAAAEAVAAAAASFGYRSPLFHVDVVFREAWRLGKLPASIFTYELRTVGRTLWGREMLGAVRPVSLANLDRRNTREILLKRLWHLAEALPARWVRGEPLEEVQARSLGVCLWRNPLDLTTVLLPEADILMPSYAQRVARWRTEPLLGPRTALDRAMGEDSGRWLSRCLARRRRAEAPEDPSADYARAVLGLTAALAWLTGTAVADVGGALAAQSRHLFREQPISPGEWLSFVRQLTAIARQEGPAAAAQWGTAPRKGWLGQGLLALHEALRAGLEGDVGRAYAALETATHHGQAVARSTRVAPAADDRWPTAWFAARMVLARAFWRTYRLADPAAWPGLAHRVRDSGEKA